jgi:hypothetical protein
MTSQWAARMDLRAWVTRRWERGLFLGLLLTMLAARAIATPDPAPDPGAADARLERKVSLKLARSPLSEIAAELRRQTGVPLTASAEVADEPAVVFVTDLPLREVMDQLAKLFDYRWARSGEAPAYSYRLRQERESAQAEQALRDQDRLRLLSALERQLREQLLRAQQSGDRRQYALLQVVLHLGAAQWKSMLEDETVLFSSVPQPGAAPLPAAVVNDLLPEEVQPTDGSNRPELVQVRAWLTIEDAPTHAWANLQARPEYFPADDRFRTGAAGVQVPGIVRRLVPEPPAADPSWIADPVLGRKRPLKVELPALAPANRRGPRPYEILPAIAESYGINLVGDAYRRQRRIGVIPQSGQQLPLYEVLNRYVLPGAAWRKEGNVVLARGHTWYQDRLAEVPDRLVRYWSARLRERRELNLDEIAALALALRNEQLEAFDEAMRDEGLRWDDASGWRGNVTMTGNREMLRAYGSLLPAQRQAFQSGQPVAYAQMPLAARQRLRLACDRLQRSRIGAAPAGGLAGGRLRLARGGLLIQHRVIGGSVELGPGPIEQAPRLRLSIRYEPGSGSALIFSFSPPSVLPDPRTPDRAGIPAAPGGPATPGSAGQAPTLLRSSGGVRGGIGRP